MATTTCREKLCTVEEAVQMIQDDQTVACGGFVGICHPEALTHALEKRFLTAGAPRNLTLIYAAGQGDRRDRGLNHLAHEGLLRRIVCGHVGLAPKLGRLAVDNRIEAYIFPQGVVCQLLRDIAAGRPGCITHVGLETFIDPIHDGGRVNSRTTESLVERIELGGKTWLWYKSMPVHVGLIRATAADPHGNLVMDEEAIIGEVLPIAQAAHNCGGIVLAQVKRLLDKPACPHHVRIPGILVDRIVVAEPHEHDQTFAEAYNPAYVSAPTDADFCQKEPIPLDARRLIAARACDELQDGDIANLGIGIPEGIAQIAVERNLLTRFTLTVESGLYGGMPAGGLSFGASVHPQAIIDQTAQFDFYDGRALDYAALGAAEIDSQGNVNVSKFGSRLIGVGGFVNITQTAKRLVFCSTLMVGELKIDVVDGRLRIIEEGNTRKFVERVEHLSFCAARSREVGQEVLYITERAVFRLSDEGLELIELAPGIDLEKQVLSHMAFQPIIRELRPMPLHLPGAWRNS